jgi:hypothetical protein
MASCTRTWEGSAHPGRRKILRWCLPGCLMAWASRLRGSPAALTGEPACTAAWSPVGACLSCWTTRGTRRRCVRCCPAHRGCLVLVTSRARLAGLAVDGNAELLALDVLSDAEARQLLAVRVGADRVAAEPEVVSELIVLCARLPLAVAIAAARAVADPQLRLSGLAAELRDAPRRLDGLDTGDGDMVTSVRAVLSWSYRQLPELSARTLRLLAVHPGPGITAAATASLAGISCGAATGRLPRAIRCLGAGPGLA